MFFKLVAQLFSPLQGVRGEDTAEIIKLQFCDMNMKHYYKNTYILPKLFLVWMGNEGGVHV